MIGTIFLRSFNVYTNSHVKPLAVVFVKMIQDMKRVLSTFTFVIIAIQLFSCNKTPKTIPIMTPITEQTHLSKTDTATFGAGCFWCVEAVFQQLDGVISVTSGYSGGSLPNP